MNMNLRNSLTVLLAVALGISSCSRTEDPTFSTSPSERIELVLSEAQKMLTEPSNGWMVRIYPSAEQKWGGYTVFLKFGADGTLTAANELFSADATYSSHYKIDNSILPSVNFDTYNQAIHVFSEPNLTAMIAADKAANGGTSSLSKFSGASSNRGLEGDYSYQLVSLSADTIILRGMRSQSLAVMTRASSEAWSTQLKAIQQASDTYAMPRVQLTLDGKTYNGRMNLDTRHLRLLDENENLVLNSAFAYTANGIELYDKATIGNTVLSSLVSSSSSSKVLTGSDGKVTLAPREIAISELVAEHKEMWTIYTQEGSQVEASGRFKEAFDKFFEANPNFMFISMELGASTAEGFTGFGLMVVGMNTETGGFLFGRIPLQATIENSTELTILYAPSEINPDHKASLDDFLAPILAAGFSNVGKIEKDGKVYYNEELRARRFKVETDDPVKTNWIKLTDKEDSTNWIKINKAITAEQ